MCSSPDEGAQWSCTRPIDADGKTSANSESHWSGRCNPKERFKREAAKTVAKNASKPQGHPIQGERGDQKVKERREAEKEPPSSPSGGSK